MANPYRRGKPPHIGWWKTKPAAGFSGLQSGWRWWDGRTWSAIQPIDQKFYYPTPSPWASANKVLWNEEWPEKARVPRLDETWTWNTEGKWPGAEGEYELCLRYGYKYKKGLPDYGITDWNLEGNSYDIVAWRKVC